MEHDGQESRQVYLYGELDAEGVADVIDSINQLSEENRQAPIKLHIVASMGGDAQAGMALLDVIQARCTSPVHVFAWGMAASAAALILAAGDKRMVGRNTMVMVHGCSIAVERQSTDGLLTAGRAYQAQDARMWAWLDQTSGQVPGYWLSRVKHEGGEVWLTATEAVDCGLADAIVRVLEP